MTRYIFITGGVSSSLGKGIASASLGALLQARGFKVRLRKLDPYLNVDPGTMNPYQHGEVFVTDDGIESDLDLGHYERFTSTDAQASDYTTTGKIYSSVLSKERKGEYLGATVQVIPHITDEIKRFITSHTGDADFILCEIGGTVGDIEGLPYLDAIRQLRNDLGRSHTMFIHLTLLPYIAVSGELKTKPTQHSVKDLLHVGIQPDILLCRSDRFIPEDVRRKLSLFCNVEAQNVIAALDVDHIYRVPVHYHHEGLDDRVCHFFGLSDTVKPNLETWKQIVHRLDHPKGQIRVAIVGKYINLPDAYKSLIQALTHGALYNNVLLNLVWVNAEDPDKQDLLETVDGIIVPGGFGHRGLEGKLAAICFAKKNNTPFLGICLGMQLVVIQAAREHLGLANASSTEFGITDDPVVGLLTEWEDGQVLQMRTADDPYGGTMRLGSYPCKIKKNSLASEIYGTDLINERHRHRYEVNSRYKDALEAEGLIFSGISPDNRLLEILEYKNHPWFLATQFHPEFKSRPLAPHPLFVSFVQACIK